VLKLSFNVSSISMLKNKCKWSSFESYGDPRCYILSTPVLSSIAAEGPDRQHFFFVQYIATPH
jgi:hypothetical protein